MKKKNSILVIVLFFALHFSGFSQTASAKERLLGEHVFGIQFIWDGYGTAHITEDDKGVLHIKGEQYSEDKEEYVLLQGVVTIIDDRNISISGHLKLFTEGCCGLLDRDINYTFRRIGSRKYWRLKERNELCDQYTCAYYLDIFE